MKILENISSGYKRIATGIAIIGFLTILYIALIPAGSVAVVNIMSGTPIAGAIVKIAEWPQYNTTTAGDGTYTINNVPYDNVTGSTYTLRISAPGFGSNSSPVTLTEADHSPAVGMELYPSEPFYLPYLDDRDTRWESEVQVFNPYDFNITADVTVYNLIGGQNQSTAYETSTNKLGSRIIGAIAKTDFVGTVSVVNTRPQSLVQGVIHSLEYNIFSIAPSRKVSGSNIQYLPYLDDRDTRWDSGIQIFNPYDFNIDANLTGYNLMNGQVTKLNFTILPKSYGTRKAGELAGGIDGANVDFVGTVVINTSQPALGQGNVRTIQRGVNSIAPAVLLGTSKIQYLPYLDDRDTRWDSGVQIFNPYDFNIDANLTGYNLMNGQTTKLNFTIPPKSYGTRKAGELAGGIDGANVDFVGTVVINTSEPALDQGNVRSIALGVNSMAPALILGTEKVQYIPFVNDTGTVFDSGVQIFNPYDFSITANMTGYNNLNGQTTTLNITIPATSYGTRKVGEIAGGVDGANVDFVGSLKVETSEPALVQANIRHISLLVNSMAPAVRLN